MTVIAIGAAGIAAVLMAVQLKGMKGEYATYLIIAAGFFIFFYGISKLESIMDTVERIQGYIRVNKVYLATLVKMIGITYVAEFAMNICKDAGYAAVGNQIELFAKLSILVLSIPVLTVFLETVGSFL